MSHRITIQFPKDRDNNFYFRVFCWVDDTLYPAIEKTGYGEIYDLDLVRDKVMIDVLRHRQVAPIVKLINETLPQHFPDCSPVVDGAS